MKKVKQTSRFPLLSPEGGFYKGFNAEVFAALDWGGPRREWFELICKTLFDTSNQLFTRFSDNNQGLVSLPFLTFWCQLHEDFSTFGPLPGASER